ncbi:glycosyltransferase [Arthrobacter koreensis]|uniref:glycosyltransferase n=1 Tax=Arthrobacter koreensis TaxID=199136 RepID=UPI000A41896F|nr:glycosyltransferase [Arthrobacter koreensis]
MSGQVRASVCMAAYNGSRWIGEQIESILADLGPEDELVVVDDKSTDNTADVVAAIGDPRIRLVRSEINERYVRTFGKAAALARGQYIFLADQDDIWVPGRTAKMIDALGKTAMVAGNVALFGGPAENAPWSLRARDSNRRLANIVGVMVGYRPYYGCAMGFRRDFADVVLPMPRFLYESHDLWMALAGNLAGEMTHLREPVLYRRLHEDNETPRHWRRLDRILKARWMLLRALVTAGFRLRQRSRRAA